MCGSISDISQLDGLDDITITVSSPFAVPDQSKVLPGRIPPHSNQLLSRDYTLRQSKQLSRLADDTVLEDFEITGSPVAHNVNIKCSTGFYSMVVLPAFSTITYQYRNLVDNMLIKVDSIKGHFDNANSNVAAVIVFSLQNKDGGNEGKVTMQLHHTTRLLQFQGSSLIHGNIRAPVWFVDHIVKDIFNYLASEKCVDISNFNPKVCEILGTKTKVKTKCKQLCPACTAPVDRRSNPEVCNQCQQIFHKKCFPNRLHSCKTPVDRELITLNVPPVSSFTGSDLAHSSGLTFINRNLSTSENTRDDANQVNPNRGPFSNCSDTLIQGSNLSVCANSQSSQLNPNAKYFIQQSTSLMIGNGNAIPAGASAIPTNNKSNAKKKSTKKTPPIDSQSIAN